MAGSGGRPRDPEKAPQVIQAATKVLAALGRDKFTMSEVAATAGVGKATIYRRWGSDRQLLVDVVATLGVAGDFDFGDRHRCTTREDLVALLTAACTGPRAVAEVALLADCGMDQQMRQAYLAGPRGRLVAAIGSLGARALERGEDDPPRLDPVLAAVTVLQWEIAVLGHAPSREAIDHVIDTVVLPASGADRVPS